MAGKKLWKLTQEWQKKTKQQHKAIWEYEEMTAVADTVGEDVPWVAQTTAVKEKTQFMCTSYRNSSTGRRIVRNGSVREYEGVTEVAKQRR